MWHSDVNPNTSAGRLVAETATNPVDTGLSHRMSRNNVGHLEKVYSTIRQKLCRQPRDNMPEIDVNAMIWRIFMSATKRAVVHLGQHYQEHLRTTRNMDFGKIKQLFDVSPKMILHHMS